MPKLPECFRFDLPNALTGDIKVLTHFFEGVIRMFSNPKSHPKDALFSRSQCCQYFVRGIFETVIDGILRWERHVLVLDEIAKMTIVLFTNRSF